MSLDQAQPPGDSDELSGSEADLEALLGPHSHRCDEGPVFDPQMYRERGLKASLVSLPTRLQITAVLGVAVACVGLVLGVTPRVDLQVFPITRLLQDLGLLTGVMVVATVLALRPLYRPRLPAWCSMAPAIAGVMVLAMIAWLPAAHHAHPASLRGVGPELFGRAVPCFLFGVGFALVTWIALRVLDRRGRWLGGGLPAGAAAGLAGSIALYLHCPITQHVHLWAGHVTVLVPFVVLGLLTRND